MKFSKLYLFLCLTLLTILNSLAQDYAAMDFPNGIWAVEKTVKEVSTTNRLYYCNGDTTFNDTLFSKLYYSEETTYINGFRDTLRNTFIGGIAEFDDKTVRINPGNGKGSVKIYDYNLEIGDTIKTLAHSFIVRIIDSVQICGKYHKRYVEEWGTYPITLVEGVGYSNGLLGYFETLWGSGESTSRLMCYSEDNNPHCPSTCAQFLYIPVTENKVAIYPNPSPGYINIESHLPFNEFSLHDLQGRMLYYEKLQNLSEAKVELEGLRAGIYILKLFLLDDSIYTTKIAIK